MTEQEFRNYLAAGIVCNTLWPGVEEVKKEPVAYLYNGVGLPKLPELSGLTQEQLGGYSVTHFKYYVILRYGSTYELYIGSNEPYWGGDTKRVSWYSGTQLRYKVENGAFVYDNTYNGGLSLPAYMPIWTNFDLYDARKTDIYLTATDPIPVYE